MHVIVLICIFLLLYEKVIIISKYFKLGLIFDKLEFNNLTHLFLEIISVFKVKIIREINFYKHSFYFLKFKILINKCIFEIIILTLIIY